MKHYHAQSRYSASFQMVTDWCNNAFPEGSWWYIRGGEYGFDSEEHRNFFLLKWS